MIFAEYWHRSTGWNGKNFDGPVMLIPACGNDGVLILDERLARHTHIARAMEDGIKHKQVAFRLMQGRNFSDARPLTPLYACDGEALPCPPNPKHL